MIDGKGYLRCDNCNTILGRNLDGRVEIICYRSRCKHNNVFDTIKEYKSHKVLALKNKDVL